MKNKLAKLLTVGMILAPTVAFAADLGLHACCC